jgi:mono/diheme cytochrome c family protein
MSRAVADGITPDGRATPVPAERGIAIAGGKAMKHITRSLVLVLAVPLLGALLVACGGGEEEEAAAPAAGNEAAAETEAVAQTEAETPAVAQTEEAVVEEEEEPFQPRRGCATCHALRDAETGKYTLAYEAHERAEARGLRHPDVALDGTSMARTDEVALETCMGCHAAGAGPVLSMRDIVHPAHAFSEIFAGEFRGNCFSCHTVSPEGTFEVISGSLEVNEKGVPAPPAP